MHPGYWHDVVRSGMQQPTDRSLADLTAELVSMLASPDPVVRDELALVVLATWIEHGTYDDTLATLGDAMARALEPAGDGPSEAIFQRSFSALILAECLRRDEVASLLRSDQVLRWADRAMVWYTHETDCRGYVEGSGWAHAVAHGADLMGTFADSYHLQAEHLQAEHLQVVLDVLLERLRLPVADVWIDGEPGRMALAAMHVLQRGLVSRPDLESWIGRLGEILGQMRPDGRGPSVASRHGLAFAHELHAQLAIGISPAGDVERFRSRPQWRGDVLLGLLQVMPRATPWYFTEHPIVAGDGDE